MFKNIIMEVNKLVRDEVPKLLDLQGVKYSFVKLNDEDYITMLNLKLREELEEYLESSNIAELSDLVEVILAILTHKNVSLSEFENIRMTKLTERGGFKNRILLTEIIE